jgi:hypothetical protein
MQTNLEKQLSRRPPQGVLVPLFEQYHSEFHPSHWDKDDIEFLHDLMERVSEREKERDLDPVYSPSGLGSCMRQSFLNKNYKKLDIPRKLLKKIETHYYFEHGSWIHLKIQVKLYKLHKRGEIDLLGTEIGVAGKRGDNRGTLDAVFKRDRVFGVDIKGWNSRDFMRLAGGDCPLATEIQLANYVILANVDRNSLPRITAGLVLAENKAGPVTGFPAAVAEIEIPLEVTKELVRSRLRELRSHEEASTIPEAECQSTHQKDFKECAFRAYCKSEVERNERRGNRKSPRSDTSGGEIKVATPRRAYRPRRHRSA